ncbi:MAG: hypothetical protein ACI9W4_000456 [Rhodothermales bacterium]|jgi:hypothetical protein
MGESLGRLSKVALRDVWKHEASDFTPWLAREANLALLGDVLGIDLELEGTEKNVGPFSADILCRNTLGGHYVLVENQLERTDHSHLGQLLTYAAGLNAVSVVWIAARFADEHRAAIDWLNEITSDEINFFALEVELWRIGDSPVAPKFNVVARPNDWSRTVASAARSVGELSELNQVQLAFWEAFKEYADQNALRIRARKPRPSNWADFAIGRSEFNLSATINSQTGATSAGLYMQREEDFHLLEADRSEIERAFGSPLRWEAMPGKKASWIAFDLSDAQITDWATWPDTHESMLAALENLHATFHDRIRYLNADSPADEVGDG